VSESHGNSLGSFMRSSFELQVKENITKDNVLSNVCRMSSKYEIHDDKSMCYNILPSKWLVQEKKCPKVLNIPTKRKIVVFCPDRNVCNTSTQPILRPQTVKSKFHGIYLNL
jgi:esterase/lipase superfamily enzyme